MVLPSHTGAPFNNTSKKFLLFVTATRVPGKSSLMLSISAAPLF